MKKVLAGILISGFIAVHADLIVNGGFEEFGAEQGFVNHIYMSDLQDNNDPGVYQNDTWDVYKTIPGWHTTSGSGIEIQYNTIVDAHEGNLYVELDSHPSPNSNSGMTQDIYLDETSDLALGFYYIPRTDDQYDNGIIVEFDDQTIDILAGSRPPQNEWVYYEYSLNDVAAGTHSLSFIADGTENTYGGFIDNVSLNTVSVPEPGTLSLLGFGLISLLGLIPIRKKK
ncbi:MAG: PEP-CTERM sorting domain-containing protein [Chitinivibrionales bacterium]|nr:PEP-CTERM sorting domain-containing protein [Chitinivibrionales bacterium]